MSPPLLAQLVHEASQTFRPSGRFADRHARGKLGQGSPFAWLLAARTGVPHPHLQRRGPPGHLHVWSPPPRLYCRTLVDRVAELQRLGFVVETKPMSRRKPFANAVPLCRVPHRAQPATQPAFETTLPPVLSTPT